MLLRRPKRKRSKLENISSTAVAVLMLAVEMWYLDSLYAKETQPRSVVASGAFIAGTISLPICTAREKDINRETIMLPLLSALMAQEKSGGVTKKDPVYIDSNLYASLCAVPLCIKGGKYENTLACNSHNTIDRMFHGIISGCD